MGEAGVVGSGPETGRDVLPTPIPHPHPPPTHPPTHPPTPSFSGRDQRSNQLQRINSNRCHVVSCTPYTTRAMTTTYNANRKSEIANPTNRSGKRNGNATRLLRDYRNLGSL